MILEKIKTSIAEQVSSASGVSTATVSKLLEQPSNRQFGDLALPCFKISASPDFKRPDTSDSLGKPHEVAKWLSENMELPEGVEKLVPTGPFLNFAFKKSNYSAEVLNARVNTSSPPKNNKVLLEYSSPNIAKPYHVGHLRTSLIGNSLKHVYQELGYEVTTVDHLGDWGTQFGFVYAGCEVWGKPEEETVAGLVGLYKQATEAAESEGEDADSEDSIKFKARKFFIDLEAGEKYAIDFWTWCRDISLSYLKRTDARLGISFDHYIGESFYADKLSQVEELLEKSGLLENSKGAKGVDLGDKLGFARVTTPDGRSLYLSRDLAAVFWRFENLPFDKSIYVVGAPQGLHFQQIAAVLEKLDHPASGKIEHVGFGHVRGMKTRGGGKVVELNELLDEAIERAKTAYLSQVENKPENLDEDEISKAVGLGAIVYSTLSKTRGSDVEFSWEEALRFNGASGPYLQYALARIHGVKDRAASEGIYEKSPGSFKADFLMEDSVFELCQKLDSFPGVLETVALENDPYYLLEFATDLARAFSSAYGDLRVVGAEPELAANRMGIFSAVSNTLRKSLELLGIPPLEKM